MLANLNRELRRKNISQRTVAKMLDVSEKTIVNKMNGTTEFTVGEAFMIHREILPEFTMDYLFAETDQSA